MKGAKNHVKVIGQMVENAENNMREHMDTVYFGRVKGIIHDIRHKRTKMVGA